VKVERLEEYTESDFLAHAKSRIPRIRMAATDEKLELHYAHPP
jgi:hypothetical protein